MALQVDAGNIVVRIEEYQIRVRAVFQEADAMIQLQSLGGILRQGGDDLFQRFSGEGSFCRTGEGIS